MTSPHDTTTDFTPFSSEAAGSRLSSEDAGSRRSFAPAASYQEETAAMKAAPPSDSAGAQEREGADMSGSHAIHPEGTSRPAAQRLTLSPINSSLPLDQRPAEVLRLAIETFPQTDNWVIFYREILGVEGVVRKLFGNLDELKHWESSKEFAEVHTMLAALRSHDTGKGDTIEAQRMITVRLPMSLHEALKLESKEQNLSINKLCITKLLHKMDPRFVPQELGKRRGRKPGPQGKRTLKANS